MKTYKILAGNCGNISETELRRYARLVAAALDEDWTVEILRNTGGVANNDENANRIAQRIWDSGNWKDEVM